MNTNSNTDSKLPPSAPTQEHLPLLEQAASFETILTEDEGVPQTDLIQIVVKRTGGSEAPCLELSIEKDATVMDLKTLIQDELADESPCLMVPVERQRLLFLGKMLTNNALKLTDDIKMKVGSLNYIHLAPLPKNIIPSARTPLENKSQSSISRRQKNRSRRTDRPYSMPMRRRQDDPTTSTRTSTTRAFLAQPRPVACSSSSESQAFHHMMAPQSLFPSLDAMLVGNHNGSMLLDDSVLTAASNELMPLCRVINSNVSQIIQCNSSLNNNNVNAIDDEHTMLATEQTIILLDQLAQRSSTLARSLRTNLREQRHLQLLSARELLEDGLPWGNY
jgi:hypothetical protein